MRYSWSFWETVKRPRYGALDIVIFALIIGTVGVGWLTLKQRQLMAVAFRSPLREVRVAVEPESSNFIPYRQNYDFSEDWFTWNLPVWKKVLEGYKGKPDIHYLEIGVYEGRSVLWMLENILTHPTARMTGIDPFDLLEQSISKVNG